MLNKDDFDYEFMKKTLESVQKNFEQITAETDLINKQATDIKRDMPQPEVKETVSNNSGYSITINFDNSQSSREILIELAKKSLIAKCRIEDIVKGIIVEDILY